MRSFSVVATPGEGPGRDEPIVPYPPGKRKGKFTFFYSFLHEKTPGEGAGGLDLC